ncbi:hypothetical protein TraAM80_08800 [Trypanosoma rangeli]|uniref:C3H1-type domain-containing protein n=1 Tax=Trypanosoma rangeli TaxID=5698 RepID=A0A3R7N8C6_TRYRA|nr:uncharacterized protein TraAM80_08800 [Trypanosoma rangeli]RNE98397.1 hypothetical protein TraAM80_08800 [Trypanosoma rangeli]|eukprot:RNE98397.1 hypothetical protein TraAM80_08800 [Trypanosoma rangeli]
MAVSSSIFLYITGGRTLWVPGHTPAPGETKPVQILNFASPRELSRSFYLFDMPIQLVNDPSTAAMIPGGKTPEDVITAVNEFRRVCIEDQNFLLKRCYDANKPPPPSHNPPQLPLQPQPQQSPQQQQQSQPQQQLLTGIAGMAETLGTRQNPAFNAAGTNLNQALLLQLLQQQQQQQRSSMPLHASPLQQPPPMNFNRGMMRGCGNVPAGGNMMMNSAGLMPQAPSMGYNNNYFNPMMAMGGRSAGLMPTPNSYSGTPTMGRVPAAMMGHRGGGSRGMYSHGQFQAPVRDQPEALPNLPPIPPEILEMYMDPRQKLMCATMPGPRCTVWLREHEIPPVTKNPRYVFCKEGIVLMLKTKGSEVENSKPVELFEQQLCAHFLIHNYCSRTNCLHRHHTETQLRQLIAGKHVELMSMTKKERHRLSERVLEKERESLARAAEDREQRARERMDAARRREGAGGSTSNSEAVAPAPSNNPPLARVDASISDDDDADRNKNEDGNVEKDADKKRSEKDNHAGEMKSDGNKSGESPSERHENETSEKGQVQKTTVAPRRSTPFASRRVLNPADIGVTDDEDDDDGSSSSSSSSSSASSSAKASSTKNSTNPTDVVNTTMDTAADKKCDDEVAEVDAKASTEATTPAPLPAADTTVEEAHDAGDVVAAAESMTQITTGGEEKEDEDEDEDEKLNERDATDVADRPEVAASAEVEEQVTVENEDEEAIADRTEEEQHQGSEDVPETAEGESENKKPKGKSCGTKRTRSPVAKKPAAKGKRPKK